MFKKYYALTTIMLIISLTSIITIYVNYSQEMDVSGLRLYIHASGGWFYDKLYTTILTIAITPIVVEFTGLLPNSRFSIINFAEGKWSSGEAGVVKPSKLPSLGYA